MSTTTSSSSSSITTSKQPQGALIFLHGLGDSPKGWSSLERRMPQIRPRLAQIEYVFPAAPIIPLDINDGARMSGWFSLYDWPIEVGCTDDKQRQLEGVEAINAVIDRLVVEQGIDPSKIVVAGFSQGGAIALLTAYHQHSSHAGVLGGCAALSGWLTLTEELQVPDKAKETPLFWAHGQYDDKVMFDHQAFGIHKLHEQGVQHIESKSYEMGHTSSPGEIIVLANFIDKIIFGQEQPSSEL